MPSPPSLPARQMFFSPREVAAIAGLSIASIYRHHRQGLAVFERLPSGSLRMSRGNLITYLGGDPRSLHEPSDPKPGESPEWRLPPVELSPAEQHRHSVILHEVAHLEFHRRQRDRSA